MPEYKCKICKKIFKQKSNYISHLNRKNPCKKPKYNIQDKENIEWKCECCGKIFTRKDNLNRHLKDYCRRVKNNEIQKEIEDCKEQIKELKDIIKQKDTTENKIIFNNNININQNINIIAFGKEDLQMISDDIYKKILNRGFRAVPTLIEHVHFNKNLPQNHNVYISNIRGKYAMLFDGNDWKLEDMNDILDQICDDKKFILENKFNNLYENLDEYTIEKFERYLGESKTDIVKNMHKNEIKLMMYNKRQIIENTKKTIKPLL